MRRRKQARAVMEAGGCILDVAEAWGCTSPAVVQWMNRHDLDEGVRQRLADNGYVRRVAKLRETFRVNVIERMRLVALRDAQGVSRRAIAKELGISPPALKNWVNRHAPDSIEQAIEDLSEDEQSAA